MSIRALIVDPAAPEALRLTNVPEPVAGPGQVLIDVHHASLNYVISTMPDPAGCPWARCWARMLPVWWPRRPPMALPPWASGW